MYQKDIDKELKRITKYNTILSLLSKNYTGEQLFKKNIEVVKAMYQGNLKAVKKALELDTLERILQFLEILEVSKGQRIFFSVCGDIDLHLFWDSLVNYWNISNQKGRVIIPIFDLSLDVTKSEHDVRLINNCLIIGNVKCVNHLIVCLKKYSASGDIGDLKVGKE